ncbi:MAG TPA: VTT domain-containing protein [Bryobacteraceae bacterium]|jgi:membrane protein YqaA with SNARE-associated domain|nr:VTT domain-containing protein [Bryobacteraceae bacterium]
MSAIIDPLFRLLIGLGAFGLLILGVLDSSFLFMPLGNDLLMVAMTARQHKMLPVFAAMATTGSVAGCWLVDRIARTGGEKKLDRVVSRRQLEFVKRQVRKNAGWAVAIASLMPPPFPFTPIVAAASAFQYPAKKLLGLIAVARFVRFSVIGLLAIAFGQQVLDLARSPVIRTGILILAVICAVGSIFSVASWLRQAKERPSRGLAVADAPSRASP